MTLQKCTHGWFLVATGSFFKCSLWVEIFFYFRKRILFLWIVGLFPKVKSTSDRFLFSRHYIESLQRDGDLDAREFFMLEKQLVIPAVVVRVCNLRSTHNSDLIECLTKEIWQNSPTESYDVEVFDGAALVGNESMITVTNTETFHAQLQQLHHWSTPTTTNYSKLRQLHKLH